MSLMFNLEVNPLWAFIINVIIVTSLLLIFGEMIPKTMTLVKVLRVDVLFIHAKPHVVLLFIFINFSA